MSFTELLIHWVIMRLRTLRQYIFGTHPAETRC